MGKNEFTIKLGDNLKKARKSKGMTQEEVSDLCGCVKQNIQRAETGKVNPTAYFLYRVSRALGVPVSDFFKGI